jgi:hypothetical protein
VFVYAIAAAFNLRIPRTGVKMRRLPRRAMWLLLPDFWRCNRRLWHDKLGQISLATTTLFWGVSGNMRYIVLAWAAVALGYGTTAGLQPGGRGGHGHGRRGGGGVDAHAAGPRHRRAAAGHAMGRWWRPWCWCGTWAWRCPF